MKRLDTFLEGLLNKSNKSKTTDIADIDVKDPDEMAAVFPKHHALNMNTRVSLGVDTCVIAVQQKLSGDMSLPIFELFVKINRKLYNFSIQVGGFDPQKNAYHNHLLSVFETENDETIPLPDKGYAWSVDINDAKLFLVKRIKSYNKVSFYGDKKYGKIFEKWLGVDLDIVR